MFCLIVCVLYWCYGIPAAIRLSKHQAKTDLIVFLLLSVAGTCYLIPKLRTFMPTEETYNWYVYGSISNYILRLLHIQLED